MSNSKRKVLITGCSDGGLGASLAVAFHNAGLHVYATARKTSKMAHLASLGIETIELDVMSEASIAACVAKLTSLDILVNNAGAGYSMPFSDISILEAKKLFDLNVWSQVAVTQAFLPMLIKSRGLIVNQTSGASLFPVPLQSAYNASKAAMALFSATQRFELAPFGIKVVDLKTNAVRSNFFQNHNETSSATLPQGSIYEPARNEVEHALRGNLVNPKTTADQWARSVVPQLLKANPPATVWGGDSGWLASWASASLLVFFGNALKKMSGMDAVEKKLVK